MVYQCGVCLNEDDLDDGLVERGLYDEAESIVEIALECNYEKNCTRLYKGIEREEWDVIASFLDTGYWPGNFFPDDATPQDQARTWVTRFQPGSDTKLRWSQLPLHLAVVVEAPVGILRRLLELYPRAIRCTDDQHMLPLHLAMRYGADDDVVAYLLQEFPAAINVKGKNSRTTIECAMRSRKKARARILTTFVEQSRHGDGRELQAVKSDLEARDKAVDDLRSHMSSMETSFTIQSKDMTERIRDLTEQKKDLEWKLEGLKHAKEDLERKSSKVLNELQASKYQDEAESQKRMMILEELAHELEDAEKQVRAEERMLRDDLSKIELRVARSFSKDDLDSLKTEVNHLQVYRIEHRRAQTLAEIESLKGAIENSLSNPDGKSKEEIDSMKRAIQQLMSFDLKSDSDLSTIRKELGALKLELRTKRELSRTQKEMRDLKDALKGDDFKNSLESNDPELLSLQATIESMSLEHLEQMKPPQLLEIRKDLAILRKKLYDRQIFIQASRDMAEVKLAAAYQHARAHGFQKKQLESIQRTLLLVEQTGLVNLSTQQLLDLKLELLNMKSLIKEHESTDKMNAEMDLVRIDIETAMQHADTGTKKEIMVLKRLFESIPKGQGNDKFMELMEVKQRLVRLTNDMVSKREITKTKDELALMKRMLGQQMKENDHKTKQHLNLLKQDIDLLHTLKIDSLSRSDFEDVRSEMVSIWKKMAEVEDVLTAKRELEALKRQIATDIARAKGSERRELVAIMSTIDAVNLDNHVVQSHDDWLKLKDEIQAIKLDLKRKELKAIKRILEQQLKNPGDKTWEELAHIQEATNVINMVSLETANSSELTMMRANVETFLSNSRMTSKAKRRGIRRFFRIKPKKEESLVPYIPPAPPKVQTLVPPRVSKEAGIEVTASSDEDEEGDDKPFTTEYGDKVISKLLGNPRDTIVKGLHAPRDFERWRSAPAQ